MTQNIRYIYLGLLTIALVYMMHQLKGGPQLFILVWIGVTTGLYFLDDADLQPLRIFFFVLLLVLVNFIAVVELLLFLHGFLISPSVTQPRMSMDLSIILIVPISIVPSVLLTRMYQKTKADLIIEKRFLLFLFSLCILCYLADLLS